MVDPKSANHRQHYFLVAGEIFFRNTQDEGVGSLRLNAVVIGNETRFAVRQIAKAQQALQFQFHKKMNDPLFEVVDVVLIGLMPLGQFTATEFNATPEGTKVLETSGFAHTAGSA